MKTKLSENVNNPNKFWKTVKEIFPINDKSNRKSKSFILDDGKSTTDKKSISKGFCKVYSTVANKIKEKTFLFKDFQ